MKTFSSKSSTPMKFLSRIDWWGEALLLALVVAETALLWPVVDLILGSSNGDMPLFPPVVLFMLLYVGSAVPRWLDKFDVWEPRYQIYTLAAVLLSTIAAIKLASFPDIGWFDSDWVVDTAHALIFRENSSTVFVWGVILLSGYAWWRGHMRDEPGPESGYMLFRVGAPVVLIGSILRAIANSNDTDRLASRTVLVFFASVLAAVGIARLRTERERMGQKQVANPALAYLLPVAIVALIALLGAILFSHDVLETTLWFLSPLIWALSVIVRVIVLLLALVAFVIMAPFLWLLSDHPLSFGGIKINPGGVAAHDTVQQAREWANAVPDAVRYIVALAILGLLFSSVTKFILRRRRRSARPGLEEREYVVDPIDLFAELGGRLKRFLRRGKREADSLDALRHDPRWRYTVAVRETYREFLAWCREERLPRTLAATPAEHAVELELVLVRQEARMALAELTERYNSARYAPIPASAADADAARRAWRTLKQNSKQG
jgi:hypothetical protein